MDAPGWLSRRLAEVPDGEAWLGEHERRVLQGLKLDRRRADWRLGRWTAKAAVSARVGLPPEEIEILAAADGAPEAWCEGKPMSLSVSLSHRGAQAVAAVGRPPLVVGCDLELVESRSDAFVRQWLAPSEQALMSTCPQKRRALLANLIWAGKEAAAKVRRGGLRLNVRDAVVTLGPEDSEEQWHPLEVRWADENGVITAWWRAEPGWVIVIAGDPPPPAPQVLSARHDEADAQPTTAPSARRLASLGGGGDDAAGGNDPRAPADRAAKAERHI